MSFVLPSHVTRIPLINGQVEPVEYRIKLTPDMENFTCLGEQEVDLEVRTACLDLCIISILGTGAHDIHDYFSNRRLRFWGFYTSRGAFLVLYFCWLFVLNSTQGLWCIRA